MTGRKEYKIPYKVQQWNFFKIWRGMGMKYCMQFIILTSLHLIFMMLTALYF